MLAAGLKALKIIFAPKLLMKRIILVTSLQIFAALLAKLYSILHFVYHELGASTTYNCFLQLADFVARKDLASTRCATK